MTPSWLEPGSIFTQRYRIERRIPGGGMGAVYEVAHVATERRCALKVMLPEFVEDAGLRERFQHEARVTARVQSEYIVDVLDAGLDEATGMLFLVMELLRGEELGKRLARLGALAPTDVAIYLGQVASALDKTHAAAIVHRDLKPENLFLTFRDDGSPRIKILDFGISKVLKEGTTHRTASLGTPLYMAPEQYAGHLPSPATDVYALGLIAYTLLVGTVYWHEESERVDNPIAFALKAVNGPIESAVARAARWGRALPPGFDAWFFQATHQTPAARFQRASDAVNALVQTLGLRPPGAGTGPALERTRTVEIDARAVWPGAAQGVPPDAAHGSGAEDPVRAPNFVRASSGSAPLMPSSVTSGAGRRPGSVWPIAGVGVGAILVATVGAAWGYSRFVTPAPDPRLALATEPVVPREPAGGAAESSSRERTGSARVLAPASSAGTASSAGGTGSSSTAGSSSGGAPNTGESGRAGRSGAAGNTAKLPVEKARWCYQDEFTPALLPYTAEMKGKKRISCVLRSDGRWLRR